MAYVDTSTGRQAVCDGCGRLDAGPNQPLDVREYAVHDPNVGSLVTHHYCAGCAANRGAGTHETLTFGWTAAPNPEVGPNETPEEHEAAMRGEAPEPE